MRSVKTMLIIRYYLARRWLAEQTRLARLPEEYITRSQARTNLALIGVCLLAAILAVFLIIAN